MRICCCIFSQDLVTSKGGVKLLAEVLFGRHHNNEAAQRYALSAIWNLAFSDHSRHVILETPGLVDAIRSCLTTAESPKTKEVAKGALWTLGG
jgi:phosphopantothenate-cysteine ligase